MKKYIPVAEYELARQAMGKAYAPYSGYSVGAVVTGKNGTLYSGCNVENAAYPLGSCAEAAAISAMVLDGERFICAVTIIASSNNKNHQLVSPCGGCRQKIREFATDETPVYLCSIDGSIKTLTLGALLPFSFGPSHIVEME